MEHAGEGVGFLWVHAVISESRESRKSEIDQSLS
jgi:hypothetical protein